MKKILFLLPALILFSGTLSAQFFKDLKKEVEKNVPGLKSGKLTEDEVGRGLKEALSQGVEKGVMQLSQVDGYLKDELIKIAMPEEAQAVEQKLRQLGQDRLVDEAIESMNRAAEDAADGAKDIFLDAIRAMTIQDAMNILKGEDDAATQYLSRTTRMQLTERFRPVIKTSLDKVDATKHWNTVFGTYNKIPLVKKVNPDLEEYVTEKALDGLFVKIAAEELKIRQDPAARATDLLKKVFGSRD